MALRMSDGSIQPDIIIKTDKILTDEKELREAIRLGWESIEPNYLVDPKLQDAILNELTKVRSKK